MSLPPSDVDPTIRTDSMSAETKKRRIVPKHGTPSGNAKRIILVGLSVARANPSAVDLDDLKELIKRECAKLHLAYDSESVGQAAEVCMARRARRSL